MTEHSFIMFILYIRGMAMGMMFSPLTSVATIGIPKEKMGQASGLINVLRQIGGSFGVALLSTLLTTRVIFHSQSYGEALDPNSPAFKSAVGNISNFLVHNAGSTFSSAAQQGKFLIFSHLNRQAFVSAISDDFLIAAVITLISAIPVFFLKIKKNN